LKAFTFATNGRRPTLAGTAVRSSCGRHSLLHLRRLLLVSLLHLLRLLLVALFYLLFCCIVILSRDFCVFLVLLALQFLPFFLLFRILLVRLFLILLVQLGVSRILRRWTFGWRKIANVIGGRRSSTGRSSVMPASLSGCNHPTPFKLSGFRRGCDGWPALIRRSAQLRIRSRLLHVVGLS
jgi:hypothetical protein